MSLEICGPRVWHFHTSPAPKIFIVCKIFQSEKTLGCYLKFSLRPSPSTSETFSPTRVSVMYCSMFAKNPAWERTGENANIGIYNVFPKPNLVVFLPVKWLSKQQDIKWEPCLSWSSPPPLWELFGWSSPLLDILKLMLQYRMSPNIVLTHPPKIKLWKMK